MSSETSLRTIEILDTPRDGDQSPLLNLTAEQKIALAKLNDAFGIDYTEAGYPASNPADVEVFQHYRDHPGELTYTKLAAFGSTHRAECAAEKDPGLRILLECGAPAIVIVGKSSRQQAQTVLNVSPKRNLEMVRDTFQYLRSQGVHDLTFDAEHYFDGCKLDPEYALETLETAIIAGVNRIVLCDTKGGSFPEEIYNITSKTRKALGDRVVWGVHMHDDANLVTANTLAGIEAGATHYQGTWLGYGERVGNADHSKVLPNLMRKGYALTPNLALLKETAEEAARILHVKVLPNAPFIGNDAFTHKAGAHVRGNARDPMANQFLSSESVGNKSRSILSKQSGLANIEDFLQRFSFLDEKILAQLSTTQNKAQMLQLLKNNESLGICYRNAEVSFLLLCLRELHLFQPHFEIADYQFTDSSLSGAEATVTLRMTGQELFTPFKGQSKNGTVDALRVAFERAFENHFVGIKDLRLIDYEVHSLSPKEGTASSVQVVIAFNNGHEVFLTTGIGNDVLAASGQAMSDAIHYCILKEHTVAPT